jgi:hypothetical protein
VPFPPVTVSLTNLQATAPSRNMREDTALPSSLVFIWRTSSLRSWITGDQPPVVVHRGFAPPFVAPPAARSLLPARQHPAAVVSDGLDGRK